MEGNINSIQDSNDLFRVFMMRFSEQMSSTNLNPTYIESVQQRSFDEDKQIVQRCTKEFIDSIEIKTVDKEEHTCSICMDQFKAGEKYISLPCNGTSHHFHAGNDDCDGIKKWLELNNSCPICRTEFPGEDLTETPGTETPGTETPGTETPGTEGDIEMTFSIQHDASNRQNIMDMVNQTLQNMIEMEEENMMQLAIQNSLESSPAVDS